MEGIPLILYLAIKIREITMYLFEALPIGIVTSVIGGVIVYKYSKIREQKTRKSFEKKDSFHPNKTIYSGRWHGFHITDVSDTKERTKKTKISRHIYDLDFQEEGKLIGTECELLTLPRAVTEKFSVKGNWEESSDLITMISTNTTDARINNVIVILTILDAHKTTDKLMNGYMIYYNWDNISSASPVVLIKEDEKNREKLEGGVENVIDEIEALFKLINKRYLSKINDKSDHNPLKDENGKNRCS